MGRSYSDGHAHGAFFLGPGLAGNAADLFQLHIHRYICKSIKKPYCHISSNKNPWPSLSLHLNFKGQPLLWPKKKSQGGRGGAARSTHSAVGMRAQQKRGCAPRVRAHHSTMSFVELTVMILLKSVVLEGMSEMHLDFS